MYVERYRCDSCGEIFAEPRESRWIEYHGEGMWERWLELLCPYCGSDMIDEVSGDED